jgi:hypothetical protein
MAKFGDMTDLLRDVVERAQKEAKAAQAAHEREQKQSEHADGHERSALGKATKFPQNPTIYGTRPMTRAIFMLTNPRYMNR